MLLASVLGLCLMLWITPPVHADDSAGSGITATDDITDTQNLLGSNVSEITDAINQTKKETGVTVRLVYLDSFNAKGKPDKWVSALLESLNPKPNTVMLAVASNDGNLVVAVSSNSEEWLKKKSTVDALSDAAQKPLMESDPDWAKSATDMMNQISVQKKTSTSSRTIWIGVGGFAGALLLLVVILVVFHILRKKGVIGHRRKGRHSGRHGAVAERIQAGQRVGRRIGKRGLCQSGYRFKRKIQNPFRKHPVKGAMLKAMSKPIEASIVVVDDEPSIRELLVASLHFAGFEVNTAASGSEAIEVIERLQPDLIVLDVMLPDIDGFTVTRRIRQEGITTPVLYLTARDDTQDKVMGLDRGRRRLCDQAVQPRRGRGPNPRHPASHPAAGGGRSDYPCGRISKSTRTRTTCPEPDSQST